MVAQRCVPVTLVAIVGGYAVPSASGFAYFVSTTSPPNACPAGSYLSGYSVSYLAVVPFDPVFTFSFTSWASTAGGSQSGTALVYAVPNVASFTLTATFNFIGSLSLCSQTVGTTLTSTSTSVRFLSSITLYGGGGGGGEGTAGTSATVTTVGNTLLPAGTTFTAYVGGGGGGGCGSGGGGGSGYFGGGGGSRGAGGGGGSSVVVVAGSTSVLAVSYGGRGGDDAAGTGGGGGTDTAGGAIGNPDSQSSGYTAGTAFTGGTGTTFQYSNAAGGLGGCSFAAGTASNGYYCGGQYLHPCVPAG